METTRLQGDFDGPGVEADVGSAGTGHLGAAHTGGHDKPDQRAPVVAEVERLVDEAGGFGRAGRVGLRRLLFGAFGYLGRVGVDPAPTDRRIHDATDGEVNLPDGGSGHWVPTVWGAARLRRSRGRRTLVFDESLPVAADSATAKFGVERLQVAGAEFAEGGTAECRFDNSVM